MTRRVPQGDTKLRAEGSETANHMDVGKRSHGKGTASPRIPRWDRVSLTSVTTGGGGLWESSFSLASVFSQYLVICEPPGTGHQSEPLSPQLYHWNHSREVPVEPWGGSSRRTSIPCLPWQGPSTQDPGAQHWEGLEIIPTHPR